MIFPSKRRRYQLYPRALCHYPQAAWRSGYSSNNSVSASAQIPSLFVRNDVFNFYGRIFLHKFRKKKRRQIERRFKIGFVRKIVLANLRLNMRSIVAFVFTWTSAPTAHIKRWHLCEYDLAVLVITDRRVRYSALLLSTLLISDLSCLVCMLWAFS